MLKQSILLGCCIISLTIQAQQQYIGTDYTLKNGLPVESIKWVEQDTAGYIWMATDNGVISFDGLHFKHYDWQTKPFLTGYFKNTFRCRDGRMLASSYKGVYAITQNKDTTMFSFFPDSASNTSGLLDQTKKIYEASDGKIWFGSQNVLCWNGKTLKSYDLGTKNASNDYFRSFQFFETQQGNFYVVSIAGWVYYLDVVTDQFVEIGYINNNITALCKVNNRVFAAQNSDSINGGGIYELKITGKSEIETVYLTPVNYISHLSNINNNKLLISSWIGGFQLYDINDNTMQTISGINEIKAYNFSLLSDGALCIGTEKGLLIRNANTLQKIIDRYITSISSNTNQLFIKTSDETNSLHQVDNIYSNVSVRSSNFPNVIFSIAANQNVLFLSKKTWEREPLAIYTLSNNKITLHKPDNESNHGEAFFMEAASDGSLWICQGQNDKLIRMLPDKTFKYYGKNEGILSFCVVVREHKPSGKIVAGSEDTKNYLFEYNPKTDRFENISKLDTIKNLTDLAFDSRGAVYIAAKGVFRVDDDSAFLLTPKYAATNFSSISVDSNGVVYATADMLYKITNNETIRYGEESGLLSVPNYRCLHIDKQNRLWVGTPMGLNMMQLDAPINTPTPFLTRLETEGKVQLKDFETAHLTAGNYLHLQVNAHAYPNNALLFEYRVQGIQNDWIACTKHNEIFIPELHSGNYNIEIRALKQGNYTYSTVHSYAFRVQVPWYFSWWFVSLVLLMLSFIIWVFINVNNRRLLRQQHRLEQIVKERTAEIEQQKNTVLQQAEQLQQANNDVITKNNLLKLQHKETQQAYIALEQQKLAVEQQKNELQRTLENLQATQKKLVEAEKMASLGNLVAGVAHEINTPVGVAITSISTVINEIKELVEKYENNNMSASDFESYVQMFYDGNALALKNLERTAQLVRSFKQISLDQHSEQERKFNINDYLHDILASINPEFKHTQIKIAIDCPPDLVINSYPGAFAQIFTNLLTNSKRHGFRNRNEGQINIVVKRENDKLHITYTDNGHGINEKVLPRIFDPFFTTDMQGGTGLGLNILYNLVTQKLGGEIKCESREGEGVKFLMTL